MKKILCLFVIITIVFASLKASAQISLLKDYFFFGAYLGLNYNIHNSNFSELPNIPNCCPNFNNGTGYGFNGGVLLGYAISGRLNGIVSLGIDNIGGKLVTEQLIPFIYNDIQLYAKVEHSIDTKIIGLNLGAGIEYKFTEYLSGIAKLNASTISVHEFTQQEKLLSPDGVYFENGSRTRNYLKGKLPNITPLIFSITLGVKYLIRLEKRFYISPELNYSFGFSNIISGTDWKISSSNTLLNFIYIPDSDYSTPIEPAK